MLTLAKDEKDEKDDKKKRKTFDDKKFTRAARLLYKVGQFTPEMMSEPAVMGVIEETYGALAEAVDSSLRHETPDNVRHALQENAFIFSGFKTYHSLREVGLSLTDEKGDIKPFDAFLGDVKRINELYNHNYLYAEYNHAVASALMADKWKQYEADGDKYYLQYRTAKDDRVRETHRALHGTTLPLSDTFWDSFLPPNGWNCRCSAVQVRKEDYQPSDHDMAMMRGNNVTEGAKNAIFRYNPGKTLRLFPPKHPYFPKNCGECKRNLNLSYDPKREKCQVCGIIHAQIQNNTGADKRIENYNEEEWERTYTPPKGGFVVTQRERIAESKASKAELKKFDKEMRMCKVLADNGHDVEYLKGVNRPTGQTYDIHMDGIKADLKCITGGAGNIVTYAKKALKEQGAEAVIFELPTADTVYFEALAEARRKTSGQLFFYILKENILKEVK